MKKTKNQKTTFYTVVFALVTVMALPFAVFTSCDGDPDPEKNPPVIDNARATGIGNPVGGIYTVKYANDLVVQLTSGISGGGGAIRWTCDQEVTFVDGKDNITNPKVTDFEADKTYTFTLTVTNTDGTATKTVRISVAANVAPTITTAEVIDGIEVDDYAYEVDFTNPDNRTIQLQGSATDPDNDPADLIYTWTCTSRPNGAALPEINNASENNSIVSVDGFNMFGDYEFTLEVEDGDSGIAIPQVVKVSVFRVATTTLDIESNTFSAGIGTELDFTPIYAGVTNTSDFATADINSHLTYTITVVNYNESYTNTWNSTDIGFDGKIFPKDEYDTDLATFTQTFYHNGQEKGMRTLKVMTADGRFEYFGDNYESEATAVVIPNVSISRKVTEGDIVN